MAANVNNAKVPRMNPVRGASLTGNDHFKVRQVIHDGARDADIYLASSEMCTLFREEYREVTEHELRKKMDKGWLGVVDAFVKNWGVIPPGLKRGANQYRKSFGLEEQDYGPSPRLYVPPTDDDSELDDRNDPSFVDSLIFPPSMLKTNKKQKRDETEVSAEETAYFCFSGREVEGVDPPLYYPDPERCIMFRQQTYELARALKRIKDCKECDMLKKSACTEWLSKVDNFEFHWGMLGPGLKNLANQVNVLLSKETRGYGAVRY